MDPNDGLCGEAWAKKSSSSNAPGAKMTDYGLRFHQPFQDPQNNDNKQPPDWDPIAMLSNLSFLEQKIHQLQDMVHSITTRSNQDLVTQQQQQLVTTDLTSIIVQLISTAGSLLPSVKHHTNPTGQQFEQFNAAVKPRTVPDVPTDAHEDHEMKDEEDNEEILAPGSYEILQLEKDEILAPHTHFCTICGKGFKRDANLRMHMRGHGDEYKTPAALAKPASCSEPSAMVKRYSCPFAGCKRNKDHKKFQPLKTILCVKNHYKRTHCDKSYVCSRCNAKKFSVIADLKTHEKHCGRDKWLCSCGTTFSRKDKLFGHIALFQGHTPAIPPDCNGEAAANKAELGSMDFDCGTSGSGDAQALMDFKSYDPAAACFSPLNFDSFQEFNRQAFDDSDGSLSFLLSGSCNYNQKSGLDS